MHTKGSQRTTHSGAARSLLSQFKDVIAGDEGSPRRELLRSVDSTLRLLRPGRVAVEADRLARESLKVATGISQVEFDQRDWRFKDPAWQDHPGYRRLGQLYLAWCAFINAVLKDGADADSAIDWRDRERAKLAADILTSTLAPTNFLLGNPAALRECIDSHGKSLFAGTRAFIDDLRHNGGLPRIVDDSRFTLGDNLAASAGAVVHRSDMLELIGYTPTTEQVYPVPTLIIAPQINKYYFMDLAPGRSFVEYATAQGVQTFITSWRNPGKLEAHWDLNAYTDALLDAVDALCEVTGGEQVNVMGLCSGGIQSSLLLNTLAARGDQRVRAATFAVTLLDWNVPGPVGAFRSSPLLQAVRRLSRHRGVLPGGDLAKMFVWLRPNDLVWSYWVNNYLMGNPPPSFDILAWNNDSTNLPAALHSQFLDLYEHNLICESGALDVLGHPVDLKSVSCDRFVVGAIADHLTPWQGCFRSAQLFGGDCTFVLSNAGHIASLVNPPGNAKASYFTGPAPTGDAEQWLAAASKHSGSWWQAWAEWTAQRSGDPVGAADIDARRQRHAIEAAPGRYVRERTG